MRNHSLALVAYLVLAWFLTLPGSVHPATTLLGDGGDNYQHAWFLWVFSKAVASGRNPFQTDLILYPFGANLSWSTMDPLAGFLALPLSWTLGPVLAYNVSLIIQLALAAFFARLLCLRVCGDPLAATIGGIIFGFNSFMLTHALGHLSLVTAFPIPLYVLALHVLLEKEKPSGREGALLGLALLLTALANYEYAVFCLLFTVVVLAVDLWSERGELLRRVWRPLLVGAVTFTVCFSPLLAALVSGAGGVPPPHGLEEVSRFSADALGFFVPSYYQSFVGRYVHRLPDAFFRPGGEGFVYLGFIPLIVAIIGLRSAWRRERRWVARVVVAGAIFAVFSLGPNIHLLGKPLRFPAPGALFFQLKLARFVREPGRLAIVTMLCLAVLVSLSLASRLKRRWLVLCLVGAGVVMEYSTLPFPHASIADPAPFDAAAKTTERCTLPRHLQDCTVLTLPLFVPQSANRAMWMQMMDGGRYRLIEGYAGSYVPNRVWAGFDRMPLMHSLRLLGQGANKLSLDPAADRLLAPGFVQDLNLCAVVVFDAPERPIILDYVEKVFNEQEHMADDCAVFELRPQR